MGRLSITILLYLMTATLLFSLFALSACIQSDQTSSQKISPSGRIVFRYQKEVYVMNADGSNRTRITNNNVQARGPALSPDGNKIAFASKRDGNLEIYVMNADGGNQTRLTNNTEVDVSPAWSPDSTKIVFRSFRNIRNVRKSRDVEIYVINADGSSLTRLTNNNRAEYKPAWSLDGSKITFWNEGIYVMNADGSNETRITKVGVRGNFGVLSPDGSKITFERNDDIYVMNADGSNEIRLTKDSSLNWGPAWSPDGKMITFQSKRYDNNFEIFIMGANGSNKTRITRNSAGDFDPQWVK